MIAMAIGTDEIQSSGPTPAGRSADRSKIPFGAGAAMQFAPDGLSLWVASPGLGEGRRSAGPCTGWTPRRAARSSRRSRAPGRSIALLITPDGRYLVGAVLGLHPEDRGPQGGRGRHRAVWRTASIMVWETASGRAVRQVDVNADSEFATALMRPTRTWLLARREIRDGLGPARLEHDTKG